MLELGLYKYYLNNYVVVVRTECKVPLSRYILRVGSLVLMRCGFENKSEIDTQ